MKSSFIMLLASFLLIVSCKKGLEPQDNTETPKVAPFTETTHLQENQNSAPAVPLATTKAINPAHGQPGHRCDIAVGAPLNEAASTQNTITTGGEQQTNPNTTVIPTPNSPAATPHIDGMNPPHGQENHRCDIAVGAPLPKE